MKLRELLTLYRLARRRLHSEEDYKRFQAFQAELILAYLGKFGVSLEGQVVLDLGSGLRGYSEVMARKGAKLVLSLDQFLMPSREPNVHPLVADALRIPLADQSIDLVFCASLIEHVSNPWILLQEIRRVMRPGGFCYLSFPPFYSPRGGHEFAPFHYFGERIAVSIYRLIKKRPPKWVERIHGPGQNVTSFSSMYERWGLYKTTIRGVRSMIARCFGATIDVSTRYIPFNTANIPLLGEVLTWHVQFLVKKAAVE